MSKIREMLVARRAEIRAELGPLKAELREIERALTAIGGGDDGSVPDATPRPSATVAEQTQEVLRKHIGGLENRSIAQKLNEEFGRKISPRNMSWHLSKMKREGLVVNDQGYWKIPPKDEAPDASASGASKPEGGDASSNIRQEPSSLLE